MKIYLTIAVFILSLSTSCRRAPIDEDTMSDILYELYLIDNAYGSQPYMVRNSLDSCYLFEPVFRKYGYTYSDYSASIAYYLNKKDRLYEIFVATESKLNREKDRLTDLRNREKAMEVIWEPVEKLALLPDSLINDYPDLKTLKWTSCPEEPELDPRETAEGTFDRTDNPYFPEFWNFYTERFTGPKIYPEKWNIRDITEERFSRKEEEKTTEMTEDTAETEDSREDKNEISQTTVIGNRYPSVVQNNKMMFGSGRPASLPGKSVFSPDSAENRKNNSK